MVLFEFFQEATALRSSVSRKWAKKRGCHEATRASTDSTCRHIRATTSSKRSCCLPSRRPKASGRSRRDLIYKPSKISPVLVLNLLSILLSSLVLVLISAEVVYTSLSLSLSLSLLNTLLFTVCGNGDDTFMQFCFSLFTEILVGSWISR